MFYHMRNFRAATSWRLPVCLFALVLAGAFPRGAAGEDADEPFDIGKTFVANAVDPSLAFGSRDVFWIQGIHVSSPHPDGYDTEYNSYNKVVVARDGDIVFACSFDPGTLDTPDRKRFLQEKAALAVAASDDSYAEFIVKKAMGNEVLMDQWRFVPNLKVVAAPKIVQNTAQSILVVTGVSDRNASDGDDQEPDIALVHGYVVFRNHSFQFLAAARQDREPVKGETLFLTWINKFLEWNK